MLITLKFEVTLLSKVNPSLKTNVVNNKNLLLIGPINFSITLNETHRGLFIFADLFKNVRKKPQIFVNAETTKNTRGIEVDQCQSVDSIETRLDGKDKKLKYHCQMEIGNG